MVKFLMKTSQHGVSMQLKMKDSSVRIGKKYKIY